MKNLIVGFHGYLLHVVIQMVFCWYWCCSKSRESLYCFFIYMPFYLYGLDGFLSST